MLGLLKKDFYIADRSSRLLLVLSLLFNMIPNAAALGGTYAVILPFMVPLTLVSFDEKCGWDRMASMLPYRIGELVGSKYLLAGFYTLLSAGTILLGAAVRGRLAPGSVDWSDTLATLLMMLLVTLLVTAIGLPMTFRYGSENVRLMMVLLLAMGAGAVLGLRYFQDTLTIRLEVLAILAVVVLLTILYISFRLSVRFYQNRRNGVYG